MENYFRGSFEYYMLLPLITYLEFVKVLIQELFIFIKRMKTYIRGFVKEIWGR